MNKEFAKKMIKAEMLRYEAIKEILPDTLKKRINSFEKSSVSFLKEIAIEILQENSAEKEEQVKKETKKVKVDFS